MDRRFSLITGAKNKIMVLQYAAAVHAALDLGQRFGQEI